MGLMDDSIKEISEDFIYVSDFIDLVAMLKTDSIKDLSKYLLRERFDEDVHVYSIDRASRISKVEDGQYVTRLLEAVLEECACFSDEGRLPRHIVLAVEEVSYFFKRKQANEVPCIKKLGIDISKDNITQEISLIYENRINDIRAIAQKACKDIDAKPNELHFKSWLNLDEVACIMSDSPIEIIKLLKMGDPNLTPMLIEFWSCRNYLTSEVDKGNLKCGDNGMLSNESVAKFLYENGFMIAGFNEGFSILPKNTSKADHASDTEELSDNTAKDYQVTIGLLLELLQRKPKGFSKDGKSLPALFPSQAKIIEAIAEQVVPKQGESKLETRFGLANKAMLEAKKNRPRPIDE